MRLLVGLRVSSRSPPMLGTTRPMPRFRQFEASMASSSVVLRASRSGLVTVKASPVAQEGEALVDFVRCAHAGRLFAEYASPPRGLQVALPPSQARRSGPSGRCPRIADNHRPPPLCPVCIQDNTRRRRPKFQN